MLEKKFGHQPAAHRFMHTALAAGLLLATQSVQATVLEEVIVTAEKRARSVQDIPLSIKAFSGDDLQQFGMIQPKDLGAQVPGLFTKTTLGDSAPTFTVRGIGLNDFVSNNNSPTSLYIDEVYQPFHPMAGFALFDVERVEVLKGPQGTLYGRNNTGGAIKFITRKPSAESEGQVRLDYGRFDTLEGEFAAGGALSDSVNARAALYTRQGGSWQKDRFTGEDLGDADRIAARVMLHWQASDALDVLFEVHGGRDDGTNMQVKLVNSQDPADPFSLCPAAVAGSYVFDGSCTDLIGFVEPDRNPRTVGGSNAAFPEGPNNDSWGWGGSMTLNWDMSRMTLTSATGYDRYERSEGIDADGQPGALADGRYDDSMYAFSQELRLTSDDSWSFDWIAGLYYSYDNIDLLQRLGSSDFLPILTGIPAPIQAWQDYEQDTRSVAGFLHFEVPLAERWSLTGGLRATHEKREFEGGSTFVTGLLGNLPLAFTDDDISTDDLSGKIGLNFEPSADVLLYAHLSKGFKSGGFNASFAGSIDDLQPFDKEELWALEAGWKASLLDGRMTLNGAAYYYDWRDFQAQIFVLNDIGTPNQVLTNAGDAEVFGFEADMTWRVSSSLDLNLAANWIDAEVDSGQLKGQKLANTPERSLSGFARYTTGLGDSGMNGFAQLDFSYRSEVNYRLNQETGHSTGDGYWLANARAGVSTADEKVNVAFWVRNLTDEEYLVDAFEQLPINILNVWGAPRTYGVSVGYNW
ncbi:TonB-dependent receptor [Haliea sp.]